MPDKSYVIKIDTKGDPSGAKVVERSIDDIEQEVVQLERELRQAPLGGKQFTELGGRVKVARAALQEAEGQAKRLGATVGRRGNAGGAVLEFSRAFEDAQYGIRGVLNNIPGLIAMLGGSAGLAGVISLAAVAGTQLWERLRAPDETEEELESVGDVLRGLADQFDRLAKRRQAGQQASLADIFDAESSGIDRLTDKILANIEVLKNREKLGGEIDAGRTADAVGEVQRKQALGELSADAAAQAVFDLKDALARREIERQRKIGDLNIQGFIEKTKAADAELVLRDREQALVAARITQAEEQQKAFDEAAKLIKKLLAEGGKEAGRALEPEIEIARRSDKLDEAARTLGLEDGLPKGFDQADLQKYAAEQAEKLGAEIESLSSEFTSAVSSLKAAREALRDAQNQYEIASTLNDAANRDRSTKSNFDRDQAARNFEQEKFAGQNDATAEALGDLATDLASQPGLQEFAAKLQGFVADKVLTADELSQTQVLLGQFFAKIANLGATQNDQIRSAISRVDELEREARRLRSNQGGTNP